VNLDRAAISLTARGHPPTFTMLTTAPGPDVAPYHNRQVVVVRPNHWSAWLYLSKLEAELPRPLPKGSLEVVTVREEMPVLTKRTTGHLRRLIALAAKITARVFSVCNR
jgi:putative SOS response-associated peptidase YedK